MELKREWKGRSAELRESVLVQMFSGRNSFGRLRKMVRVSLIFEETGQEFFKDYVFEGMKADAGRNTSPLEVAEPAYINEVSKALKSGYKKLYSSLDSLSIPAAVPVPDRNATEKVPAEETPENRNTLPKTVNILTRGVVSLDTMRAWKREMDFVYAGGEFA